MGAWISPRTDYNQLRFGDKVQSNTFYLPAIYKENRQGDGLLNIKMDAVFGDLAAPKGVCKKLGSGNSQTALVRSAVQTLMLVAANALLWFARINAIAYCARTAARTLRVQGRYAFGLVGRLASQARRKNG